MDSKGPTAGQILVDAHVHFHPCFDPGEFLDGARRNFRAGAAELGLPAEVPGCLLFSEAGGARGFQRFQESAAASGTAGGAWAFEPTDEPGSLLARRREDAGRLVLVAGRQIATRDGLEVLALVTPATEADLPDGLPLGETLELVRERGAVAVLPWGFGKWWRRRGRMVRAALPERAGATDDGLFLGDNGGRPAFARPRLFRDAAERGVRVLPGTDPLPLRRHAGRAGSHGFLLAGPFDERRPAASLRRLLHGLAAQPRAYGRPAGLLQFVRDQSAMQWRKRAGGGRP